MYILCRYSYIRFRTHMHQHYLNGQKQAISGSRIHGYGNFMCTIESLSLEREWVIQKQESPADDAKR